MTVRKIAVVTGTRAEYGLLKPVLALLASDRRFEMQLIVTGQHLLKRFGDTIREIPKDGFRIAAKIDPALCSDRERDIARSMGAMIKEFARAYDRLRPDILVVLGDRYEILSAAAAALPFRIPVAHIHGGESTEGLIDEQIRHAVTKLSHIHFPVTAKYRDRILAMGEDPRNVHCFGTPGLDGISTLELPSPGPLRAELGIPPGRPVGVITFHPVTLEPRSDKQAAALFQAASRFPDLFWVCTLPNADTHHMPVIAEIERFVNAHPRTATARASLGRLRYLALLKQASVVVGNSSSGLIEAPSFRVPTVDIGDRQKGRIAARNVIRVPQPTAASIERAIARALSPKFRRSLAGMKNPYGGDGACRMIVEALAAVRLGQSLLKKRFVDGKV